MIALNMKGETEVPYYQLKLGELAVLPAAYAPASVTVENLASTTCLLYTSKAVLRDKKEVKADSLQNPNDPDATYRAKNDQKVQGYVNNITETVEEGKPNLITSVQVETAVFADCHFLQEAVENLSLIHIWVQVPNKP